MNPTQPDLQALGIGSLVIVAMLVGIVAIALMFLARDVIDGCACTINHHDLPNPAISDFKALSPLRSCFRARVQTNGLPLATAVGKRRSRKS
jgi:hypothetical protein